MVVCACSLDYFQGTFNWGHLLNQKPVQLFVVAAHVTEVSINVAKTVVVLPAYSATALNEGSTAVKQLANEKGDAWSGKAAVVETSHETLLSHYQAVIGLSPSELGNGVFVYVTIEAKLGGLLV